MSSAAGPTYSEGILVGTPLDTFDLNQAMIPGMSEATEVAILAKALTYWQTIQSTSKDTRKLQFAALAIPWIQARQVYVNSPTINSLHIVYPV